MKKLIVSIATGIVLFVVLVTINGKKINHYNNQYAINKSPAPNRKQPVSVPETKLAIEKKVSKKPEAETMTTETEHVETKPVENRSFEEDPPPYLTLPYLTLRS